MIKSLLPLAALVLSASAIAQDANTAQDAASPAPKPAPGPSDFVNRADQSQWQVIKPEDMLVMTLAPDADGSERVVIIQLMPKPFSQGWVENMRTLARANWYDKTSVNRVQDNYVVQWGDPNYDNPESAGEARALPDGLNVMTESDYVVIQNGMSNIREIGQAALRGAILRSGSDGNGAPLTSRADQQWDIYAENVGYVDGWPVAFGNAFTSAVGEIALTAEVAKRYFADSEKASQVPALGALSRDEAGIESRLAASSLTAVWPVHCYGMVGVGRNYSPDTGSGAELYTVIGHAPRHLDRNIALVGRIISGMEHLSSLPRGSGVLGFYSAQEADERTPILSVRVASDLPEDERPLFEYLSTSSNSFASYLEARANRRDPFFLAPAGGADICNVPVPVRRFEYTD